MTTRVFILIEAGCAMRWIRGSRRSGSRRGYFGRIIVERVGVL